MSAPTQPYDVTNSAMLARSARYGGCVDVQTAFEVRAHEHRMLLVCRECGAAVVALMPLLSLRAVLNAAANHDAEHNDE